MEIPTFTIYAGGDPEEELASARAALCGSLALAAKTYSAIWLPYDFWRTPAMNRRSRRSALARFEDQISLPLAYRVKGAARTGPPRNEAEELDGLADLILSFYEEARAKGGTKENG